MKIKGLLIALAILASVHQVNATTVFPIATNANVVEVAGGFATSGTNDLAAILSGTNVCFQLESTNGTLIGPLTTIGSSTSFPLVAFGGGKYLVYWDDNFIDSGGDYGQIISPNGSTIGSPFSIGPPGEEGGGLGAPQALCSDGTNFLAVFEEFQESTNDFDGQLVTPAGTTGATFLISSQQQNGNAAAGTFGKTNYLVVWMSDNGGVGNMNQAFGEFVSGSGIAGSPFQISQTASTDQSQLAVAFDGTNYFAVWPWNPGPETGLNVTNWDLHARLVSQTGTFPANELDLITDPGSAVFPSLAFDGSNYLLAWGELYYNSDASFNPTNSNTYFRFFNRSGSASGPEFTVFTAQSTNTPLFALNGLLFDGSRFTVAGFLGTIATSDGNITGFPSGEVFGGFIPASTASPSLMPGNRIGTQFPLLLTGTSGINYAIQFSTNLAASNWTAVVTNSPTNGTFSFTDVSATNSSRFYHAVKQ